MKNIEKNITGQSSQAGFNPADAPVASDLSRQTYDQSFKTLGQKIHNEITYRGVDWLLNSTVGVMFAVWANRSHSGQKWFSGPIKGGFKALFKPLTTNPHTLEESAKWGATFASIMAGGTAIIPPMMALESKDIKKPMIRWMDEKIYGKEKVENDPKFQAAYRSIDFEAKKDFATGMWARLAAITPLIAITSTPVLNRKLERYMYEPIAKYTKKGAHALGIKPTGFMTHEVEDIVQGVRKIDSNWDYTHRTIGFDFGQTIFYAILHEQFYKALARRKQKSSIADCMESVGAVVANDDPANVAEGGKYHSYVEKMCKLKEQNTQTHADRYLSSVAPASEMQQVTV